MATDLSVPLPNGNYPGISWYNGISIKETAGRTGTDTITGADTATRSWLVRGSVDPVICKRALVDGPVLINEYDGLFIESLSHDLDTGPDAWSFTASYNAAVPSLGGYTVSCDTTGGTIMQTTSYGQTRFPAPGTTAPDFLNSIDVQDGKPNGIQRIIPSLKINVRAKIATEYVGSVMGYVNRIASLTGTTNGTPMFGGAYAIGEILFAGASGLVVGENPELTFSFLASANLYNGTIGNITGINKPGHDYIWFLHDHAKDTATGMLVSKPRAAYVDKIYGAADHGLLKIGVPPT